MRKTQKIRNVSNFCLVCAAIMDAEANESAAGTVRDGARLAEYEHCIYTGLLRKGEA